MPLNKEKYENLILYIAQKLGGRISGKKKLAKVLYFVDFDYFEKYERSITGDVYRSLPMGPVPKAMTETLQELTQEKKITIDSIMTNEEYNPTEVYTAIQKPDISCFTSDEVSMIDRVVKRYGLLSGKQLEFLTHNEAPYIGTKPSESIDYELSFYRGTSFEDL